MSTSDDDDTPAFSRKAKPNFFISPVHDNIYMHTGDFPAPSDTLGCTKCILLPNLKMKICFQCDNMTESALDGESPQPSASGTSTQHAPQSMGAKLLLLQEERIMEQILAHDVRKADHNRDMLRALTDAKEMFLRREQGQGEETAIVLSPESKREEMKSSPHGVTADAVEEAGMCVPKKKHDGGLWKEKPLHGGYSKSPIPSTLNHNRHAHTARVQPLGVKKEHTNSSCIRMRLKTSGVKNAPYCASSHHQGQSGTPVVSSLPKMTLEKSGEKDKSNDSGSASQGMSDNDTKNGHHLDHGILNIEVLPKDGDLQVAIPHIQVVSEDLCPHSKGKENDGSLPPPSTPTLSRDLTAAVPHLPPSLSSFPHNGCFPQALRHEFPNGISEPTIYPPHQDEGYDEEGKLTGGINMGRRCLKRPVLPVMDGLPKCMKTRDEGLTVTESGESPGDMGVLPLSGEGCRVRGESVVRIFDPVHSHAGDEHGAPASGEKEEFLVRCVLEDVFEEKHHKDTTPDTDGNSRTMTIASTAGMIVMDMEQEQKGTKPWCGTCAAFSKNIYGFNPCTACVLPKISVGVGEDEVSSAPMIQQEKEEEEEDFTSTDEDEVFSAPMIQQEKEEEEDSTSTPAALPSPSADDMEAMS